ncbi:hypothetical protein [Streptomyces sp. SID2888]|uniref:hypothetical protein n=1 Tax=Streptomyces sp. SID2888 TaxID=2690256 RepID=UPI00136ED14A|nr:hypothetical protein [Streptomyces sp. SID2888]MYV47608.1 hypothetical protein [Streptomyces sp. SID2888]
MDLDTLRFGNFASLDTAISDWQQMVKDLETLEKDARDGLKARADKANWSGVNSRVSREFITRTAGEFTDAHTQATTIHNILKDTRDELVGYRDQLNEAISRGLQKNLTVVDTAGGPGGGEEGSGSFTVSMNIHPDRAAQGTTVPDHSQQDVDELRDDVERILSRATRSENTAAEVLKAIAEQTEYGFSSTSYKDRDEAARAMADAKKYANLMKNKGDDMSPEEFDELNRELSAYKNDPLFQETFATTLGPKGVLDFWADLSDPSDGGDLQRARRDQLGDFQRNLSLTLAGATQSNSPAMQGWEDQMVRLGNEQIQTRGTRVYGFQLMSNLMRVGDYDDGFLNKYGNALVTTEEKMRLPDRYWNAGAPPMPKMNFMGEEFGRDPMTGFMTALSSSPDAATEFFNTTKPQDNAEWVLKDRPAFDDTPLDSHDSNQAREATGKALLSATSGIYPFDDNAVFTSHTPEQEQVLKRSLEHLAAAGDDFPSEMRDDMARALGSHGNTVHLSMSDASGSPPLDKENLLEVTKQISRSQDAYGLLNEKMNVAIAQDIHAETEHPEDSLDRAGRTVGFLEAARYQAVGDRADGELSDAAWKKAWTYHLVGGVLTPLGGGTFGDPLQRGVDVITSAWLEDEQGRINDRATNDNKDAYELRSGQLKAIADEWYRTNTDWANEPGRDGYSGDYGIYSKIDAAANDGNDKANGIAGKQR